MGKFLSDDTLTKGFFYARLKDSIVLKYFCDCCGNGFELIRTIKSPREERIPTYRKTVQQTAQKKKMPINYQQIFLELRDEMEKHFHLCEYCGQLICDHCHDNKETICNKCPIYEAYMEERKTT